MTKYKEFMRAKGVKLEGDFEHMSGYGVKVSVSTEVMDDCVVAAIYSNVSEPEYTVCNRFGECNYYDDLAYHAYIGDPHCDPKYLDFLFDTGCNKSFDVFESMEQMYLNDAKVRIAFKHMQAGIMDYMVFYKWISDRYQKYTNQ